MPDALAGAYRDLLQGLCVALESLGDDACRRLLGPLVAGATMTQGARVPGTCYELDPATAAFNFGLLLGWPPAGADPADPVAGADTIDRACALAAALPLADYLARRAHNEARAPLCVGDVLLALADRGGTAPRDTAAVVLTRMLGGGAAQLAQLDAIAARGATPISRRPWSVAEAAACAVRHALLAVRAVPSAAPAMPDPLHLPAVAVAVAVAAAPTPADAAGDAYVDGLAATLSAHYPARQAALLRARVADPARCAATPVHEFMALLVRND